MDAKTEASQYHFCMKRHGNGRFGACPLPIDDLKFYLYMLNLKRCFVIIEKKDSDKQPVPFDVKHVTLDGRYIEYKNCTLLTNFYKGGNVRVTLDNGKIREFKFFSVVELNGVKTFIK